MVPRVEDHQELSHGEADGGSAAGKRRAAGPKFPPDVPAALLGKAPVDTTIPKGGAEPQQFRAQNLPNLPGVRYCQWFQFKNRYADEDLSDITIAALVG